MKLSTSQVQRFWREWAASCKVMNWTRTAGLTAAEIDAHRKELLARCGFDSLTKVTRVDGFTKVLNELLVLQGTSLQAGREAEDQTINRARTLRYSIASELIPCLELYVPDVPGYLTSVMEDKQRWWKIDRPVRDITILDLDATQLEQLRYTLNARMHTLRNKAGDTICDMKRAAHIPCDCARCLGSTAPMVPAIPQPAPVEAESPF
jgi:hypothetical protein